MDCRENVYCADFIQYSIMCFLCGDSKVKNTCLCACMCACVEMCMTNVLNLLPVKQNSSYAGFLSNL